MNIRVFYRGRLHICIRVSALTGVCGVSAGRAGRLRYSDGIFVSMFTGKLGNSLFLCKAANSTGKFHHTVSLLRCFLRDLALAEGVKLGIQSDVASIAAERPMFILIVLNFT